jgi:adenine-specific DNA methylase
VSKPYPKRLIEVDLPIKAISAHARREKSIRHGHISTLHIWWARRPLAACRAVLCASLWPDPADENCPQAFRDAAAKILCEFAEKVRTDKQVAELSHEHWTRWKSTDASRLRAADPTCWWDMRHALLDFIADFANWDASTSPAFLTTARDLTEHAQTALSHHQSSRPLVVDPFAGGGSIPLETLRIGADSFASDVNPVPIVLNKVALEYIPKYGTRLAAEVLRWGDWIRCEAEKELATLYPVDEDGATPIAYLWARTVLSDAPGDDKIPIEVPLISSMWLSKKPHRGRALRWVRDGSGNVRCGVGEIRYADGRTIAVRQPLIEVFEPTRPSQVEPGTSRRGAATCPVTGFTTPVERVRLQLQPRRGGTRDARLICVVTTKANQKGRFYRTANKKDFEATAAAEALLVNHLANHPSNDLPLVPHEKISLNEIRRISVPLYGIATWGDAFSSRQLLALSTFARLVRRAGEECALANGGDSSFANAVQTLLAINVGKAADYGSALATWSSPASQETVRNAFSRQAIAMVWDYAEACPFAASSGGWAHSLSFVDRLISSISESMLSVGRIEQATATNHPLPDGAADALFTDPPYYDAVPYAHLSDFFYVWLRRSLPSNFASEFAADAVPKSEEIVVDRPHYLSDSKKDIAFYERQLTKAFIEARRVVTPEGIGAIVFASKTTASWEAILKAVIDAGWTITGSWPIDTEREGRLAGIGQARLASSVHLVCRPRRHANAEVTASPDIGSWRSVLGELPVRIHEWMPRLADEGVVGADAIFACIGPALEIFSRYSRVEKASGDVVSLKEYLEQVWAAVSKEALSLVFKDADSTGLEEDARLTAMWLWTLGGGASTSTSTEASTAESASDDTDTDDDEEAAPKGKALAGFVLEYDAARKIAQGLGAHLEKLTDVVEVKGDKARLLSVAERTKSLFGKAGANEPEGVAQTKTKPVKKQLGLFGEIEAAEKQGFLGPAGVPKVGETTLDRLHQAMILFGAGRSEALKRFVVEEGAGKDPRFWKLAQSFSALYPPGSDEKRWVDGVLARKKGLGF